MIKGETMKEKFQIIPLRVPSHVWINMHNDQDHTRVPVENLDEQELLDLCDDFVRAMYEKAGFTYPGLKLSKPNTYRRLVNK